MSVRKFSFFPKTLSQVIDPLTRPVFKSRGLAGSRLLTDWPQVVGPSLARHAAPEKISFPPGKTTGGTLTIAVENGFATELQHMQAIILERLAVYFGYKAITRVVISHAYLPVAETKKLQQRPASLPAGSASVADNIADGELKDALASLAKTLSGQAT